MTKGPIPKMSSGLLSYAQGPFNVPSGGGGAGGGGGVVLNTDIPWDGLGIGNPGHGATVAPSQIKQGVINGFSYTVKRSGRMTGLRLTIRLALSAADIHNSPGDYSAGDGGQTTMEFRPLNPDGTPGSTILGKSLVNNGHVGALCPNNDGIVWAGYDNNVVWNLISPVDVVQGQKLFINFNNTSSGWSSLDGLIEYANVPTGLTPPQHSGIYYGDDIITHARYVYGSGPDLRPNQGGMFVFQYEDGIHDGNPFWFAKSQAIKTAGGATQTRQRLISVEGPKVVDGLWFKTWWTDPATSALTIRFENADGSPIESVVVPRASISNTGNGQGDPYALWVFAPFAAPHTMAGNTPYYVRFSATAGGYVFCPQQRWSNPGCRNHVPGNYAQVSLNSGGSWSNWGRSDQSTTDTTWNLSAWLRVKQ